MATDIYNSVAQELGTVFDTSKIKVTFPGALSGLGLMIQTLGLQYSAPQQAIFDLDSGKVHYMRGRPSGQGSIGRMLGVGDANMKFYKAFGNLCEIGGKSGGSRNINFSGQSGICASVGGVAFNADAAFNVTATSVTVNAVTINAQAGEMASISDQCNMTFVALLDGN
jgi:hypothetical protein